MGGKGQIYIEQPKIKRLKETMKQILGRYNNANKSGKKNKQAEVKLNLHKQKYRYQ